MKELKNIILSGDLSTFRQFILSNPDIIHETDSDGNSLLHFVVIQNNLDSSSFAQTLLESGLDLNIINKDFNSALDIAIKNNNIQLIAVLKSYLS